MQNCTMGVRRVSLLHSFLRRAGPGRGAEPSLPSVFNVRRGERLPSPRTITCLGRPICFAPDMNSRSVNKRSHRNRIGPLKMISTHDGVVESDGKAAQGCVSKSFVPVVEHGAERFFAR